MTPFQKVFLLIVVGYLTFKLVLGFVMYIITLRIEAKGKEHKTRRQALLQARREKNMELYRRQYMQLEERKRNPDYLANER
ncbi:MAG: hypothetical protein GX825_02955 [Syntrophomonadaceae bacterium]|nr:hypothetical protein [Syntrophomonadaceae bacterium]